MNRLTHALTNLAMILLPASLQAYVGPGSGLSSIGSVLGFLLLIVLLAVGILWYPLKKLFNAVRSKRGEGSSDQ